MTVRLPLPRFTRSPIFFLGLGALHLYLGGGHILRSFPFGRDVDGHLEGIRGNSRSVLFRGARAMFTQARFVIRRNRRVACCTKLSWLFEVVGLPLAAGETTLSLRHRLDAAYPLLAGPPS